MSDGVAAPMAAEGTDQSKGHTSLAAAKAAVMLEVGVVEKSCENKFHRYKYASEFDLLRAIQPAMAHHGLSIAPTGIELQREEGPSTGKGRPQWITHGRISYTLRHADSGEQEVITVWASGIDGEDKGPYKAMTGALKYALRQAFLIPTGDDPDQDDQPPRGGNGGRGGAGVDIDRIIIEERSRLIRQILAKAIDGFAGGAYSKALQEAGCPPYEHVKLYALWRGWDKPSTVPKDKADWLIGHLQSPEGRQAFGKFAQAVGLNNDNGNGEG